MSFTQVMKKAKDTSKWLKTLNKRDKPIPQLQDLKVYRLRDDCNYKMIETLCSAKRLKLNITLFLESIDLNKLREFFFLVSRYQPIIIEFSGSFRQQPSIMPLKLLLLVLISSLNDLSRLNIWVPCFSSSSILFMRQSSFCSVKILIESTSISPVSGSNFRVSKLNGMISFL